MSIIQQHSEDRQTHRHFSKLGDLLLGKKRRHVRLRTVDSTTGIALSIATGLGVRTSDNATVYTVGIEAGGQMSLDFTFADTVLVVSRAGFNPDAAT